MSETENAIPLVPNLTLAEKQKLIQCAETVLQSVTLHEGNHAALKGLLVHLQRAYVEPLLESKLDHTADRAARQDEFWRGVLYGVEDSAAQLLEPERIRDFIAVLSEKEER